MEWEESNKKNGIGIDQDQIGLELDQSKTEIGIIQKQNNNGMRVC